MTRIPSRPVLVSAASALAVLAFAVSHHSHAARASPRAAAAVAVPQSSAIEERFGIRITRLGLTANGGMLDLRFIVLEPEKATQIGHSVRSLPRLIAEDRHIQMNTAQLMLHLHYLRRGTSYYMLFRNDGNLLRQGDHVGVRIGDLVLSHLTVV
jgi:hypothetical protein